jgi:hypothetical protein
MRNAATHGRSGRAPRDFWSGRARRTKRETVLRWTDVDLIFLDERLPEASRPRPPDLLRPKATRAKLIFFRNRPPSRSRGREACVHFRASRRLRSPERAPLGSRAGPVEKSQTKGDRIPCRFRPIVNNDIVILGRHPRSLSIAEMTNPGLFYLACGREPACQCCKVWCGIRSA